MRLRIGNCSFGKGRETFLLKRRTKAVEKGTFRRRWEQRTSTAVKGIAISYFHLENPLNMHETIAYLMQLAEANLFPFFRSFSLSCSCFFPTYSPPFSLSLSLPVSLLRSFVRSSDFVQTKRPKAVFKLHFERR